MEIPAEIATKTEPKIADGYINANVKLTFLQRLYYAISEAGYNGTYYWVSSFLMIFYTDRIGVSPALIAGLFLFVRLYDGLVDPLLGSMIDRTKSKWGRYRPWVFVGYTVMPLMIIMLFSANPNWTANFKSIYLIVFYILTVTFSSIGNMAFGALSGVMTSNSIERHKLGSLRMIFINIGNMFSGYLAMPLILFFGGGVLVAGAYRNAMIVVALIALPLLLITPIKCKELLTPPPNQTTIPLKKQFESLFKNGPMWAVIFGMLLQGFIAYGRMAVLMYYFTYFAGNPKLMSTYALLAGLGGMAGGAFMPYLLKLTKHKGRSAMVVYWCNTITFGLMFFFPAPSSIFFVLTFFGQFFHNAAGNYGMMPDAIDYGEYKSGYRCDAFLSSTTSLSLTVGGAIAPAMAAAVLASMNYVPNVAQPANVLGALNFMVTIVPAILYFFAGIVYSRYKLSNEKHEIIREELDRRRRYPDTEIITTEI